MCLAYKAMVIKCISRRISHSSKIKMPSLMDVAPWCNKWDGLDGIGWDGTLIIRKVFYDKNPQGIMKNQHQLSSVLLHGDWNISFKKIMCDKFKKRGENSAVVINIKSAWMVMADLNCRADVGK